MNLEFINVQNIDRNGVSCILQRADVTHSADFWRAWRTHIKDELRKLIYLSPETNDGKTSWYAFRLKAINGDEGPYIPFNLTYQLKHTDKLLSYQPLAVSHLVQSIINNGAAADGSDTGIGKTYHALGACRELGLRPVVICRKAGMAGWRRACEYMNIIPLLIINWESVRLGKMKICQRTRREYRKGYDYRWDLPSGVLLIFDEAHAGFNEDSQNHALWTASRGLASISMSATFADRPSRLRGLFHVLNIMDRKDFDRWLEDSGHYRNQYNEFESLTAIDDMKKINRMIYPKYGYRISYDDPAVKKHFPGAIIQTEIVDLGIKATEMQNIAYLKMLKLAAEYKEKGKQADLLVADLRYRQYAELLKAEVLCDLVREYLYEGFAVCVFVNFRETLKYMSQALDTKSLLFGGQEGYGLPREKVVEDFQQGRNKVILCMAEAGGQSIDLHDVHGKARRMSLICPTYNPVSLQQVLGRTNRAGSKTSPIMKLVYAAGTVEEKVADVVNRKLDNIAALNNGDLMEPDLFQLRKHEKNMSEDNDRGP